MFEIQDSQGCLQKLKGVGGEKTVYCPETTHLPLDGTILGDFRKHCIMKFKLSNYKNIFREAGYDQISPGFCAI